MFILTGITDSSLEDYVLKTLHMADQIDVHLPRERLDTLTTDVTNAISNRSFIFSV